MRKLLQALELKGACHDVEALIARTGQTRRAMLSDIKKAFAADLIALGGEGYRLTMLGRKVCSGEISSPLLVAKPVKVRDTVRQRCWNAIQALQKFTVSDVVVSIRRDGESMEALRSTVASFVSTLKQTRYVEEMEHKALSQKGRHTTARYRLIRNTGYIAPTPTPKKNVIYDHNTGKTIIVGEPS